jgi:hypothetical protein
MQSIIPFSGEAVQFFFRPVLKVPGDVVWCTSAVETWTPMAPTPSYLLDYETLERELDYVRRRHFLFHATLSSRR